MGYGDLQFYDIIIFAGIAAFLVFRLRNVLGKRTGAEKNNSSTNLFQKESPKDQTKPKEIPELSENLTELKKAYEAIYDFDHIAFLEGAKVAYETIINSFNNGDTKTLKSLLTTDVFLTFEKAIKDKNNHPNNQFFSLNIEKIEKVFFENNNIKVSIIFVSEQYKNNDEDSIVKKRDVWTFEKQIKSKDPKWLLCST